MVNIENVAGATASATAVLGFMGAILRGLKKMWIATERQTLVLMQMKEQLKNHIEVTHADQERRLRVVEQHRRSR